MSFQTLSRSPKPHDDQGPRWFVLTGRDEPVFDCTRSQARAAIMAEMMQAGLTSAVCEADRSKLYE